VADRYILTVRSQGTPHKHRFAGLDAALTSLEHEATKLAGHADQRSYGGTLIRRLDPARVVVARLEVSGPRGLRAGVDVRGDGSSEAFTGRIRRRVLDQRDAESAFDALRRAVS
jgi:hypothetical protein